MTTECCCDSEETTEECEHEFERLNDKQIFCKFCGKIIGAPDNSQHVHYCYHGCNCSHWTYPTWTSGTFVGPSTVTFTPIYTQTTTNSK